MKCLIIQPIHEAGLKILRDNKIHCEISINADMDYIKTIISPYDAVITRNAGLTKQCIDNAPNLRVIGNHGVGVNPIDVNHATTLGIPVINTPTANSQSVAEHVFAQIFSLYKRLLDADRSVRGFDEKFRYENTFHELRRKSIAIIGMGRIGNLIKSIAEKAFEMKVHSVSRQDIWDYVQLRDKKSQSIKQGIFVDCRLMSILNEVDIVTLNIPLKDETLRLVDSNWFAAMKDNAILINTARGEIINDEDLFTALNSNSIAGAALDVFEKEPLPKEHILLGSKNLLLSPHIGGSTVEALIRTACETATQVVDVLCDKRPKNLVNPESWEIRRIGRK